MSDRKINYIVIFAVIALFVLEANIAERLNLLAAILISMVTAYAVFIANLITIDGTRAAILVGTVTLGFGGTEPFVMLAAFFSEQQCNWSHSGSKSIHPALYV